ncbi:MAG: hypothetical protein SGPRY_014495, partial [Prymnesium sp.]
SESRCTAQGGGYAQNYAVALRSAPRDLVVPVLMLSQFRVARNHSGLSRFGRWAQRQGANVVELEELSFQQLLIKHGHNGTHMKQRMWGKVMPDHLSGPFLRLDIPRVMREHSLFDIPCVCPEYVLYTDADVMFWNASAESLHRIVKTLTSTPERFVMYGNEVTISGRPKNTGVFFMSVPRFEKIWPDMLRLGVDFAFDFKEKAYDQGWLNFFFINVRRHRNDGKSYFATIS